MYRNVNEAQVCLACDEVLQQWRVTWMEERMHPLYLHRYFFISRDSENGRVSCDLA